ncbi:DUF4215 domain-containing protein [Polyangium sorediatum]|uniref:DUF4215 domain-containing protein n=1 Tax=Polyangium sorediatum TaxID=889274 RepID=A0ABT6P9Z8_9BACT|nr:DUF4215 domain-containing protein [Polyangium sorediatum]MDI1437455.1 DUF4215 domain-containing protein [Polyangium sorediatum]
MAIFLEDPHMRKAARVVVFFGMLTLAPACSELAGIEPGEAWFEGACLSDGDCVASVPDCRAVVGCRDGTCAFVDSTRGTPLPAQIGGDCAQRVCDGHGDVEILADPNDADDQNACTADLCVGTVALHEPLESIPCYTGLPETRGRGVCIDGIQHCDDGQPVGGCEGEVLPSEESCISPLDDDCDGEANEEGEGCTCVPGTQMPCYTGPEGTRNVGICHDGTQVCRSDGLGYAACTGDGLPAAETCDNEALDQDCNGKVNEAGADCKCGDGWLQLGNGEICDDGNDDETDACTSLCAPPACGDGFVQPGEPCDDGNDDETDACTSSCALPVCGDGFVQASEPCDDGNDDETDACTSSCALPVCGDGFLQPSNGEACDDGNQSDADACLTSCAPASWQVSAGMEFNCARFGDGRIKCWGSNAQGQLGIEGDANMGDGIGEMGAALPVTYLGGAKAIDIVSGAHHTCALLEDHSVRCWGLNDDGQLGLGTVDLGDDHTTTAIAIAAGAFHTCAILADGAVKCWGHNACGQLGLGDITNRGGSPEDMGNNLPAVDLGAGNRAIAISAGLSHTCAILASGAVKCWGDGGLGKLGNGSPGSADCLFPPPMGDLLPAVDLGTGNTAIAISAGYQHTCVILQDGAVKCWGRNHDGRLGIGDTEHRGDEPGEMGDVLPAVNLGTGNVAIAISAGNKHTCALLGGGEVKCWGSNASGQLGLGDTWGRGAMPGHMGDALPAVDLGAGKTAVAVAASSAGFGYHTCALLQGGAVKCWGSNTSGQLGLGDTQNRGGGPGEMGDALPAVSLW